MFLPGNLESYRLRYSRFFAGSLDYRCHVNDTRTVPLPAPVEECVRYFSGRSAEDLRREFNFTRIGEATSAWLVPPSPPGLADRSY